MNNHEPASNPKYQYYISAEYGDNRRLQINEDLPSDFLEKEQLIKKEFEITDGPANVNGKYKAQIYNSIEHSPRKKVVTVLLKYNQDIKDYEVIHRSINFLETGNRFWFHSDSYLSHNNKNYLAIAVFSGEGQSI